jgi:hypothetical protein
VIVGELVAVRIEQRDDVPVDVEEVVLPIPGIREGAHQLVDDVDTGGRRDPLPGMDACGEVALNCGLF